MKKVIGLVTFFCVMMLSNACAQQVIMPKSATSSQSSLASKFATVNSGYTGPYKMVSDAFAKRDYEGCVNLTTQIMDSEGATVEGLTYRGIAYAKLNEPWYAFSDLLAATQIDYNVVTLSNLGNALRMFGYCVRAADAFEQALILKPNDPMLLLNLASSYACYGNLDAANENFAKAIPSFPQDAVAFTIAATIKSQMNDSNAAVQAARKAIELDPNYLPAYKVLTVACRGIGDKACADQADLFYKQHLGQFTKNKRKPTHQKVSN